MERYDGKTKRDDRIRYGFIALALILMLAGVLLIAYFTGKNHRTGPDFRVVLVSEEAFGEERTAALEAMLGELAGDRNGHGEVEVEAKILRITDEAAARKLDFDANEEYRQSVEAAGGDTNAVQAPVPKYSGLTVDVDTSRMMVELATGEVWLFLLSEQPLGEFPGAASVYGGKDYFLELPGDLQDGSYKNRTDLTNTPFLVELGLEDIPFYGFVLDTGNEAEENEAIALLRQIRAYSAN